VRIEFKDYQLRIIQGPITSGTGFVQVGSKVPIHSEDGFYHSLRARGSAFFSLPLATRNKTTFRAFAEIGLVELSSGAGYPWIHAELWVLDHPYIDRTNGQGEYSITQIPAGNYQLISHLPNWIITQRDLDPETSLTTRIHFGAPGKIGQNVIIEAGETKVVDFIFSLEDFRK
jgi:hypothetical protein